LASPSAIAVCSRHRLASGTLPIYFESTAAYWKAVYSAGRSCPPFIGSATTRCSWLDRAPRSRSERSILEVGCGAGLMTSALARTVTSSMRWIRHGDASHDSE
jgi:2-polyprenyl-3-methyl-5-hydroxy-6-metoxy-1,4-benzoquinol methylase